MMDNDLARRVANALSEVTVKAHTSRSKKGKTFNVKQHERNLKNMHDLELDKVVHDKSLSKAYRRAAKKELYDRGWGNPNLAKAAIKKNVQFSKRTLNMNRKLDSEGRFVDTPSQARKGKAFNSKVKSMVKSGKMRIFKGGTFRVYK